MRGGKVSSSELKQFIQASYADEPPAKIGNYELDKSISKPTGVVYHNPATGDTKVIHRGTKGLSDWSGNIAYATGLYKHTGRYKEAERVQQRAEAKYGAQNIDTIGHSQSGILARELGKDTKNIITLNPAYMGEKEGKNETVIRSSGDVVSALHSPVDYVRGLFGKPSKTHTIQATTMNPLTEHSADILDRTDAVYGGNSIISTKLKSHCKCIMNANEFKQKLKHYNVLLKKVRGHPLHQILIDNLHESYHPSRKAAKAHIIGAGFFSNLKKGLHTAVKVGKQAAPLVGLMTGRNEDAALAHTYLSAADQAMGGKFSLEGLRKGLKSVAKVGRSVAPLAGLVTGNPVLGLAASSGFAAADQALGAGNLSGGYGRQMSGGSNLSGAGNVSGGRMLKGSPEMKQHMARLRAMRRK
jgi:hypothetical protein